MCVYKLLLTRLGVFKLPATLSLFLSLSLSFSFSFSVFPLCTWTRRLHGTSTDDDDSSTIHRRRTIVTANLPFSSEKSRYFPTPLSILPATFQSTPILIHTHPYPSPLPLTSQTFPFHLDHPCHSLVSRTTVLPCALLNTSHHVDDNEGL
jgi:hypothetical protein